MKNDYNGADIYNYYGISQRDDYEIFHSQVTGGVSHKLWSDDSKLSIVASFDYYSQSPIDSLDRGFAFGDKSKLAAKFPDTSTAFFSPFGSYSGFVAGTGGRPSVGPPGTLFPVQTGSTFFTPPGSTSPTLRPGNAPADAFIPFNSELAAREERYGRSLKVNFSPTDWLKFYDPFTDQSKSGKINGSLVDAIRTQQFENARTDIATWNIHAGGPILDLCSGQVLLAGGLEYRNQSLIIQNDPNSTNRNIIAGNFLGKGTDGRRWVRSGYIQATIPIFGEQWSWPGMRQLHVVISERYDDYSLFHSAAKPQIAIMYKSFSHESLLEHWEHLGGLH